MATERADATSQRWGNEQYDRLTHPGQASVIEYNIRAISNKRHKADATRNWHQQLADKMTRFAGSIIFVYWHVVWFGIWMFVSIAIVNFDPAFGTLTMIVSLEAIFLSTFILVGQNHQGALAEHESTRILKIVADIAEKHGIVEGDEDVGELMNDVEPMQVLDRIEKDEDTESANPASSEREKAHSDGNARQNR
jgi:uncharacterized membrane protein